MQRRITRKRMLGIIAASAFAVGSIGGPALADVEEADAPGSGCFGRIVAWHNHNSGVNPSGSSNDTNARGPGYFFRDGQFLKAQLAVARRECTIPV